MQNPKHFNAQVIHKERCCLFAKGLSYQDLTKDTRSWLRTPFLLLDNRHLAATQVERKRVSVRQRLEDAKMLEDSLV